MEAGGPRGSPGERVGGVGGDTQKAGGEVAGSRFYYVFDDVVWLDFALILYALDFLSRKGFQLVVPPPTC